MVAGHLREKKGYFYAVLNYTDAHGNRKTKWIATGFAVNILTAEGEKQSRILVAEGHKESKILEAEAEKQAAILHAEAVKEAKIREAEGEAAAIEAVQKATADAIRLLNEANAGDAVIKLKALEAFSKAADGQATKIIIPSEIQGLAGLAEGVVSAVQK